MSMHDLEFDLSTLRPEPGDLLVITTRQYLTNEQRAKLEAVVLPKLQALGCKAIVLDGGTGMHLVKKVQTIASEA